MISPEWVFVFFISTKDGMGKVIKKLIAKINLIGHQVKFICCDGAGENGKYIQDIADQERIQVEYTSPNTLQYNEVAEHCIATLKSRGAAMMNAANLN